MAKAKISNKNRKPSNDEVQAPKTAPHVIEEVRSLLDETHLWTDARLPFEATVFEGSSVPLMLVCGDNCSGKSLLVETLRAWLPDERHTTISLSIRERTGSGLSEMSGMRRAMIYGQEEEQSTGSVSANVVSNAFHNANGWSEGGNPPLVVLDEPELGMSESLAGALGELIAQKVKELHPAVQGVVVVTHSRNLVRRLVRALGAEPSFVYLRNKEMGGQALSLQAWLEQPTLDMTVEQLEKLQELASQGRRAVRSILRGDPGADA